MKQKLQQHAIPIVRSLCSVLLAFAVLDALWLGVLTPTIYQSEMQGLLRTQYIVWPWLVFYLMYASVTFVLAVVPNRDKPWYYASIDGALLGLASYGAYNLTNYSIIEGFSLTIMLLDWAWGIILTACCASAGYFGFRGAKSLAK